MITGETKVFFMLAHPIGHVRTPEVLNPLLAARGVDAVMVPIHYAPEDFAVGWEAMKRTRNLGGIVVSVPLKEQAAAFADEVSDVARELGAANVVRRDEDGRMIATNFDGEGFLAGLLGGGSDAAGWTVSDEPSTSIRSAFRASAAAPSNARSGSISPKKVMSGL